MQSGRVCALGCACGAKKRKKEAAKAVHDRKKCPFHGRANQIRTQHHRQNKKERREGNEKIRSKIL